MKPGCLRAPGLFFAGDFNSRDSGNNSESASESGFYNDDLVVVELNSDVTTTMEVSSGA